MGSRCSVCSAHFIVQMLTCLQGLALSHHLESIFGGSHRIDVQLNSVFCFCRHFAQLLDTYGPLHTEDLLVITLLESFSVTAQMLIHEAGGIKSFLLRSIRFSGVDDFVFLVSDCVRGRQQAEDHRLALLTAVSDDAFLPPFVDLDREAAAQPRSYSEACVSSKSAVASKIRRREKAAGSFCVRHFCQRGMGGDGYGADGCRLTVGACSGHFLDR